MIHCCVIRNLLIHAFVIRVCENSVCVNRVDVNRVRVNRFVSHTVECGLYLFSSKT